MSSSSFDVIGCSPGEGTSYRINAQQPHVFAYKSHSPAVIRLEEFGRDLEWRSSPGESFRPLELTPPRLGTELITVDGPVRIEIKTVGPNRHLATLKLRVECDPSPSSLRLRQCLEAAYEIDKSLDWFKFVSPMESAQCRANLFHSAAALARRRGDHHSSATLYDAAASAWAEAGDAARLAAAELGLTERLKDLGDLDEALVAVASSIRHGREADLPYFILRSLSQECMLRDYTQSSSIEDCYAGLSDGFERIGEISEAANVRYNLAFHHTHRGDLDLASIHLREASQYDETLVSPAITGRLRFLASQIDLKKGRVAEALAKLEQAYEWFARAGDRQWLANANLQAARVYEHLSAPREAGIFLDQARRFYRETDARLREVAAIELEAMLLQQRGETAAARDAMVDVARRYQKEGVKHWAMDAWLRAAEWLPDDAAWHEIDALLEISPISAAQRNDIELARIASSLATQKIDGALSRALAARLEHLSANVHSVEQLQHARVLQARALILAGAPESAVLILEAELSRQMRLAQALGTPALRHLSLRQTRELGGFWVDTVLAQAQAHNGSVDLEKLSGWLRGMRMESAFDARPLIEHGQVSELDAALAGALLEDDNGDASERIERAQRSILRFYASAGATDRSSTPADMQPTKTFPTLPDDAIRLTYALGETRSFLLVARGEEIAIHEIAAPADIRNSAARLAELAYRRESNVAELTAAADALAALILPSALKNEEPPAELWIEGEELFAAIPFSLLSWPGKDWPLVESTAVSFRLGPGRPLRAGMSAVDVLVAARPAGGDSADLPWLRNAEVEPELLAATLPRVGVNVHAEKDAGRARLDELLSRAGAWLHIAAHGTSRSGFQGLAGLWLAPAQGGDKPEFVSWMGLTEQPLSASLVVLNACQLADTGAAIAASASFASALAAAGVDHVVAARWQVSDNASTVWVPAFYAALRDDPETDAAGAVRQAQLALRRSRQFRHPFYWSGLAHLAGGRETRD